MSGFPILHPDQLDETLGRDRLVLLDFWQAGCPPCRALEPRLDAFAAAPQGAFTGYRIDVEAATSTPRSGTT